MPRSPSITALMHKARSGSKPICMLLLVVFWLLLNAQMAIASHVCPLPYAASSAMQPRQHEECGSSARVMPMQGEEASTPLCEKHCNPDLMLKEKIQQLVIAPIINVELILTALNKTHCILQSEPLSLPGIGPPAEIQFCRFRE